MKPPERLTKESRSVSAVTQNAVQEGDAIFDFGRGPMALWHRPFWEHHAAVPESRYSCVWPRAFAIPSYPSATLQSLGNVSISKPFV